MNLACPVLSRYSVDLAYTAHSRLSIQCHLVFVVVVAIVVAGVTATFAGILISKIPTSKEKALSTMTFFSSNHLCVLSGPIHGTANRFPSTVINSG